MTDPIAKYINNGLGSDSVQYVMMVDGGGNPIQPAAITGRTISRPIYPTLAAFQADTPAAAINTVELDGYFTSGDGRGGKLVRTTRAAGLPGVRSDYSGNRWLLESDARGNPAGRFGRKADAVVNYTTYVATGTPDDVAIQEAIDFQAYGQGDSVVLGNGVSLLSRGIEVGYGDTFTQANIAGGSGPAFVETETISGAGVVMNYTRGYAFNMQGGRGHSLKRLNITGSLAAWIIAHNIGVAAGATLDDTNRANWAPATDTGQDSVTAPWAAVVVDGRSGNRPGTSYADYVYPPWSSQSQYNRAFSSVTILEDIEVTGVNTAFVVQPSGANGNGDFTNLNRCAIEYCAFGVSISQAQSRQVACDLLRFSILYCLIATNIHGNKGGELGSDLRMMSGGECIKLFSLATLGLVGPVRFIELYSEGSYQFGDIATGGTGNATVTLESSIINFGGFQNMVRGIPAAVLQAPIGDNSNQGPGKTTAAPFFLRACQAAGYWSVLPILSTNALVDSNSYLISARFTNGGMAAYTCLAHNATCDGLVVPGFATDGVPHQIAFTLVDLDTLGTVGPVIARDDYAYGSRNYCIPIYVRTVRPVTLDVTKSVHNPQRSRIYALNLTSAATFDQTTGIFTFFNAAGQDFLETFGGAPGDAFIELNTATVGFINSVNYGTSTISAKAQNNLQNAGRTCAEKATWPNPSSGQVSIVNNRVYCAAAVITATATSGSPTLTGVTNLTAGTANQQLVVGDRIYIDPGNNPLALTVANNKMTGINTGASTITMAGNMTVNGTVTLLLFIRQPPANAAP